MFSVTKTESSGQGKAKGWSFILDLKIIFTRTTIYILKK